MSGNTESWWQNGNDLWKSRWAPPQVQGSSKDKDTVNPELKVPRKAPLLTTGMAMSLDSFGLIKGLESSRWATSTSGSLTPKEIGFGNNARHGGSNGGGGSGGGRRRPRRGGGGGGDRGGGGGGGGGGGSLGGRPLSVHGPSAGGAKSSYDDTWDVAMGGYTPVTSPVEYGYHRSRVWAGTALTERFVAAPGSLRPH